MLGGQPRRPRIEVEGEGVFRSPNRGVTWNELLGNIGDPTLQQFDVAGRPPVALGSEPSPNGANGRIVLAMPALTGNPIEDVLYDWPIRNRIGPFHAGDVYTIPAWSINVIYSRSRPHGLLSTTLFRLLLASLRYSLRAFRWLCSRSVSPPAISALS